MGAEMSFEEEQKKEEAAHNRELVRINNLMKNAGYIACAGLAGVIFIPLISAGIAALFLKVFSNGLALDAHTAAILYLLHVSVPAGFTLIMLLGLLAQGNGGDAKERRPAKGFGWIWIAAVVGLILPVTLTAYYHAPKAPMTLASNASVQSAPPSHTYNSDGPTTIVIMPKSR